MPSSLGESVRRGALWLYAGNGAMTVGQFVLGVILARLLEPGEFGVFIAVTAFTSIFLMVVQFGMPQTILQARELNDDQVNAAFWAMLSAALVFVAITAAIAVPLAHAYQAPQFAPVMYLMSSLFLLAPYNAIGLALMRRQMQFDRVARIQMIALAISSVLSILAAMLGASVYSLVLGGVVNMVVITIWAMRNLTWRPTWPHFAPLRALLRYSSFATLNNVLTFTTIRVDNMLVGLFLGATPLGLYNRAASLARIPSDQFADSLLPLVLGSLSRIQDDIEWSRQLFFKAVSAITTTTMPFLVILLVAGPLAVDFLYGAAWNGAGAPLQMMTVGGVFLVLTTTLIGFINAQGLVRELAHANGIILVLTLVLVLALAPFGLLALAAGISLREAVLFLLMVRVLGRSQVRLRMAEISHAALPSLIAATVSGAAGFLTLARLPGPDVLGAFLLLVALTIVVFGVYALTLVALMGLWRSHAPLGHTRALLLESLGKLAARFQRRTPVPGGVGGA